MNREEMIARIEEKNTVWDIIVIGGGATGVGTALDAASRGYRTLLVEKGDFGQGTSSRSTKLAHGGVRYLQQGNISLVLEALHERGRLRRNAPHLVHNLPFIVPNYDWWEGPFYGIGLKIYDMLAGKEGFGSSQILSKDKTLEYIPTVETDGLNGGVLYYDGQFDDARLVINIAETAAEQGATLINYMEVIQLLKKNDFIDGVVLYDHEGDKEYTLRSNVVINATGAWSDNLCQFDDPESTPMIQPSQGVHIVLDRAFLPGDSAIMVPHTDDGRVLFAIPWKNKVIVGTTDTPIDDVIVEPLPLKEEQEFLLEHAARYLSKDPTTDDVLSIFAGIRPLVAVSDTQNTASISRDHVLNISRSGLVTIAGGKWTTYRKMAQDTVDQALLIGALEERPCATQDMQIHGYHQHPEIFDELQIYGSDAPAIKELLREKKEFSETLIPGCDILKGEVIWSVRNEMVRNVDDFLARRRRALILDSKQSLAMVEVVARLMSKELGKGRSWRHNQVKNYEKLVRGYQC